MKKLISILAIVPSLVFAQTKQVETASFESVCLERTDIDMALQDVNEIPFMRGFSVRDFGDKKISSSIVFFMNVKTKTWSIVEKIENSYCVIAVGVKLEPYVPK